MGTGVEVISVMTPTDSAKLKLAAIMFTDIAGYTSRMAQDQDVALSLLETKQKTLKPLMKKHNGTLVKEMGDGTLSHFPSAVNAAACGMALQRVTHEDHELNIRVGIHLGDTLFKGNDIFGDGVNVASRLESLAPPGGVLVSRSVYDELTSRKGFHGISLGLQSMKGVGRLVEVYALQEEYLTVPDPRAFSDDEIKIHKDDEVPSLAIIPFVNKGKKEDIFYAYGISADLIADVSGAGSLRISSMNDIEKVDHTSISDAEIAEKLDVRYITSGSLWKMGDMFQLSVEMYDGKNSSVIWSDRWQENWDNLPSIKGKLADGMLKVLDTPVPMGSDIITTVTENVDAYEFYLKGKYKYEKRKTMEEVEIARGLLNKAISLDKNLIAARNILGQSYDDEGNHNRAMEIFKTSYSIAEKINDKHGIMVTCGSMGVVNLIMGFLDIALEYLEKQQAIAKELDDKYEFHASLGNTVGIHIQKGDYDHAMDCLEKIMQIAEELDHLEWIANTAGNMGIVQGRKGHYDRAMEQYKKQLKISEELDDKPGIARATANMGNIYKRKGDNDLAIELFESNLIISKELGDKRGISIAQGNIGSVHVQSSNYEKALRFFERSIKIDMKIGFKHHLAHVLSKKAHVLFEVKKFNESKMTNEKCKLVVKEINTEEFDFNLNLLTEKIRFVRASSEDQKIAVVNALEDMVHDNENKEQCAVLHFELWIMKKELSVDGSSENRDEALKQYHSMHNKIPDYAYKQKIKKLRND